jgi:phosphatidylinositol dimannoside acyltransferase
MARLVVVLRRLAQWGARSGPRWWLRYSPSPIGTVAGWLARRQHRRVVATQHWVRGSADGAGEVFRNYAHCLAESLAMAQAAELDVEGREHLEAVLGRGLVLLTAHTGAWELVAGALAKEFSSRVNLVLEPEAEPELWRLQERQREERGLSGIRADAGPESALGALSRLRAGGWVALQVDRPGPSRRGLRVKLFGRAFQMPEGPFRIAKVSGAPLVPVFNARVGFMRYRIQVFPAIWVPQDASHECLAQAAQAVADCLQAFVARHPTQWFHFYDPPPAGAD